MIKSKIEELADALDDVLSIKSGLADINTAITAISEIRTEIHKTRKTLSGIEKQMKDSENTMYAEILGDSSLKNAESRKIALDKDKTANPVYTDLSEQRQEQLDRIAEKERDLETATNRFKAVCINAEQKTAIINALAKVI